MKILLVGDGYYLQNYCKYISILNKDIDVYIFCTNNSSFVDFNIIREEELDTFIKMIDRVYFWDDGTISSQIIRKIKSSIVNGTMVKHIFLNQSQASCIPTWVLSNKPCVLVINDGNYNCCADLELQLIKCFYDEKIRVACSLCDELSNVISTFRDIIQPKILEYLDSQEGDLIIISMDSKLVFDGYNLDVIKLMSKISPDFIIFCQEKNDISKQEKEKILQYRYGLSVDMIAYSEYITYNNVYGSRLYCKNIPNYSFGTKLFPMHQHIGKIVFTEIKNKLYFPSEIRRIVP